MSKSDEGGDPDGKFVVGVLVLFVSVVGGLVTRWLGASFWPGCAGVLFAALAFSAGFGAGYSSGYSSGYSARKEEEA